MHVADPRGPQLCRQGLPVELRVVSRSGDTAYVYDALDAVRSQKLEKVFPCAGRMPNRQDSSISSYFAELNMDCRRRSSTTESRSSFLKGPIKNYVSTASFIQDPAFSRVQEARLLLSIRLTESQRS